MVQRHVENFYSLFHGASDNFYLTHMAIIVGYVWIFSRFIDDSLDYIGCSNIRVVYRWFICVTLEYRSYLNRRGVKRTRTVSRYCSLKRSKQNSSLSNHFSPFLRPWFFPPLPFLISICMFQGLTETGWRLLLCIIAGSDWKGSGHCSKRESLPPWRGIVQCRRI